MAKIDGNYNIETVRGNVLPLRFRAKLNTDGSVQLFKPDDVVRFKVMQKGKCDQVVLQKDETVKEECESISMVIDANEMKIGPIISTPVDYWYEVEVNPDTPYTVTILGYTSKKSGPRILTLLPEGGDKK